MNIRAIAVTLLLIALVMPGCVERRERPTQIDPNRYFPLNLDDSYLYSGAGGEIKIISRENNLFTRAYMDVNGEILTWEDYNLDDNGVYWNNVALAKRDLQVHFEPPIPFAPWSNIVGDTMLYSGVEIRNDSVNSHIRIQVACEILAIEDVTTPAGEFKDCIKMKVDFSYLEEDVRKIFAGEITRWFAKDVGIVRYETTLVSGELIKATVSETEYPL